MAHFRRYFGNKGSSRALAPSSNVFVVVLFPSFNASIRDPPNLRITVLPA